jgi:hypothetical protein
MRTRGLHRKGFELELDVSLLTLHLLSLFTSIQYTTWLLSPILDLKCTSANITLFLLYGLFFSVEESWFRISDSKRTKG